MHFRTDICFFTVLIYILFRFLTMVRPRFARFELRTDSIEREGFCGRGRLSELAEGPDRVLPWGYQVIRVIRSPPRASLASIGTARPKGRLIPQ